MIDIEKLKQAALNATRGEWDWHQGVNDAGEDFVTVETAVDTEILLWNKGNDTSDVEFIAAANPSAVLELITRLEELQELYASSAFNTNYWKGKAEAAESQLASQELVIKQLRDALIHHQKLTRPIDRSYEALAIPTSTEHLEAWYKEMVGPVISAYPRDGLWEPLHAIKPFKGE